MPKRKKRVTRKNRKKQGTLNWAFTGLFLLILSALSTLPLGFLGNQFANLVRFFVGDSHLIISSLLAVFGLVMLIYNQPPHLGIKRFSGLILAILGLLLYLSHRYFDQMMIHQGFINVFWYAIVGEFGRANITISVGGGLIGSLLYQGLFPLIGTLGCYMVAFVSSISGLLMIFKVTFRQILSVFQKIIGFFVAKNKSTHERLKATYATFVEQKKAKKAKMVTNRQNLQDPIEPSHEVFPDMQDFNATNTASPAIRPEKSASISVPEKKSPQIEIAQEAEDVFEQSASAPTSLPKPHGYEQADENMASENDSAHEPFQPMPKASGTYELPPLSLLAPVKHVDQTQDKKRIMKNTQILESTFKSFGVNVEVKTALLGPTVTRYEVRPAVGVKVSRIVNLADDLALALAAKDIRIEAPIPGKPLIGIEVPNKLTSAVSFKEVMAHQDAKAHQLPLDVPLGKDVTGRIVSADLRKMPHLLIAGSTGSGKSVAINTFITSILMKANPDLVKLVLIDPKMVELSVYNGIPHLLIPVVTDAKLAANALHKTVKEMERRYQLFAAASVRNMTEYNQKVAENNADKSKTVMLTLPYIVVIVDELSDLMMVAGHDVEDAIVRLAQMARAAGIHMILATQRPSVDVITGLIKANVPSRISFAVSSSIDSRTILDQGGAEKLIGRGDLLFMPIGAAKPERVQGAFISVDEVEKVVSFVKTQQKVSYSQEMMPSANDATDADEAGEAPVDEYYDQAVDLVKRQQQASVSMLQRRFRIGYNRAARIVDQMEANGVVGPSEGSKPREVLMPPPDQGQQGN